MAEESDPSTARELTLTYAPHPARRPFHGGVFLAGLATTGAALFAVYLLDHFAGFNAMGLHVIYVIPAGAIVVGMAAGTGFGVGSIVAGHKIRDRFLLMVIAVLLCAFFAAQYIEFKSRGPLFDRTTGRPVGFWRYFDIMARNFAWKSAYGPGKPVGEVGYLLRLAEIVGFALGGLATGGMALHKPYCELCNKHLRERLIAVLPAGVSGDELVKGGDAVLREHARLLEEARMIADRMHERAVAGDVTGLAGMAAEKASGGKAARKLPRRVAVYFRRCPNCRSGEFRAAVHTGFGSPIIEWIHQEPVPREFISGAEAAIATP